MLSNLSVSNEPERCLRHRYSSRYLRLSLLHREFPFPLSHSSKAVSNAVPGLSPGLSHLTYFTTYIRFTPSNSEQRLRPLYYRGCWHRVSRLFLCWYHHCLCLLDINPFFPADRDLQPESLHHSRGIAASGLRPLCKIPHCCLP